MSQFIGIVLSFEVNETDLVHCKNQIVAVVARYHSRAKGHVRPQAQVDYETVLRCYQSNLSLTHAPSLNFFDSALPSLFSFSFPSFFPSFYELSLRVRLHPFRWQSHFLQPSQRFCLPITTPSWRAQGNYLSKRHLSSHRN